MIARLITRARIVLLAAVVLVLCALSVSTGMPVEAQPGPPIRIKEKRKLPEETRARLNEIRDRVRGDRSKLVADRDDEDVWVSYVAAAGALALVGLGLTMVRRNQSG